MRSNLDQFSREIDIRPALSTDRPIDIFRFLRDSMASGHECALVTLAEISGGAARARRAYGGSRRSPMPVSSTAPPIGFSISIRGRTFSRRKRVLALAEVRPWALSSARVALPAS
jgi:hypothetical protein